MSHRGNGHALLSTVAIVIFIVSMFYTGALAAVPRTTTDSAPTELEHTQYAQPPPPPPPGPPPENGTSVWWHQESNSASDEWTWQSQDWLFGPRPEFDVFHQNGSMFGPDDYAEIGEQITVFITIPKGTLAGAGLSSVRFDGWYISDDSNYSAAFSMSFNVFDPVNTWSSQTYIWNYSISTAPLPEPPFVDLVPRDCSNSSSSMTYYVTFAASFQPNAPVGLYSIDLVVEDTMSRTTWVHAGPGRGPGPGMGGPMDTGLAVGMAPSQVMDKVLHGAYTLEKVDLEGDTLYSVSRGKDFIMRFNITGEPPSLVTLAFDPPSGYDAMVNDTGWHPEVKAGSGGWVYNDTLDLYVWNASLQANYVTEVYGEYQRPEWVELTRSVTVNTTVLKSAWNETKKDYDYWVEYEVQEVPAQYVMVFNSTDFYMMMGYHYRSYPYDTVHPDRLYNDDVFATEPLPDDMPVLYELNESRCNYYTVNKTHVVEFVGHFTDKMPKSSGDMPLVFQDTVMGPDNVTRYWPATNGPVPLQSQSDYEMAKQIAIDSPVTIARLLLEDGTEPPGWLFLARPGTNFMVRARLQGGSEIADDIDGARLTMDACTGMWTEDERVWTTIRYELTYDMDTGVPTLRTYNQTVKENMTYGVYTDYVEVTKTGWHYEYNKTTNRNELVYGKYTKWEDTHVEGWPWETWFYNQRTGLWQSHWIDITSADALVNFTFCQPTGFMTWQSGGDLYVQFLVNMTEGVPETQYFWNFHFTNNTWHEDPSLGWGEHKVLSWSRERVYSFWYHGERVYADPLGQRVLAYKFLNSTLYDDYMKSVEIPYIVLNGQKLPIRVHRSYNPISRADEIRLLSYESHDSTTGEDIYYYELLNGTKIHVTSTSVVYLYNVTTVTGDTFITTMDQDYGWHYNGTWYPSWIDIYGNVHQGGDEYQRPNLLSFELYDVVFPNMTTPVRYHLRYGRDNVMLVADYWWEDAIGSHVVLDTHGNLYELRWNDATRNHEIKIGGNWKVASWPEQYIPTPYGGVDIIVFTRDIHKDWYTTGYGGQEVPYPGAKASDYVDLDNIESQGGKVPTFKMLRFNESLYRVYNISDQWYVDIDGSTYELEEFYVFHTVANHTDIWLEDDAAMYFTNEVGTFTGFLEFAPLESFDYFTDDYYGGWPMHDEVNDSDYFDLLNGTSWLAEPTQVVLIYELAYNGTTFYTMNRFPESQTDNDTESFYYYDLNHTKVYVDSQDPLPVVATYVTYTYTLPGDEIWLFDFMNKTYHFHSAHDYIDAYHLVNATYSGGDLFVPFDERHQSRPTYNVTYLGSFVNLTYHEELICRVRVIWGMAMVYGPVPIESTVYRNFNDFIVGTPEWGLWGITSWGVDPTNGALDLDGDFETTDDQYYILERYTSVNQWNHTWNFMDVGLTWDPNATAMGDEINVHSWMGLDTFSWRCSWNQTFYWYHADTMKPLNATEMAEVQDTLYTSEGEPKPGYWDIAWMGKNITWADIVAEAKEQGWDWIDVGGQSWTWMSFGITQDYGTAYQDGNVTHWLDVGIAYQYSGLMVWEDDNNNGLMDVDLTNPGSGELTHFLVPDSVENVSFVTPGMAYGNPNATGHIHVSITDEVTWGVSFYDINGTVFPFTKYAYWDWYDEMVTGTDMRTFDERPTKVTIDELTFLVHFRGHLNTTSLNNWAEIKVDNYVGNWDVDMVGGKDNLENRSLALNYLADVRMSDFAFKANGSFATNEQVVGADVFAMETAGAKFAEMIMGGTTYKWGKNSTTPYDVVSYTTPLGTFQTAFESDNGMSATAWSFSSSQYYVSIGFPEWEGYDVFQDPVFVSYVSSRGTSSGGEAVSFGTFSVSPSVPQANQPVEVGVDIYTQVSIDSVELQYSLDQMTWYSTDMSWVSGSYYTGTVPGYPQGTTVYVRVVVHTQEGDFVSPTISYTVGQGVTTTTTTTTTTTGTTTITRTTPTTTGGGGGPLGPSSEMLLVVGGGVVILLLLVFVLLRRRR